MFVEDAGASAAAFDDADQPRRRAPIIPSAVLGMLIFVATETMFFAGLVSAFLIGKASAVGWPPLRQPRAPVEATAFNTAVLLASGVLLFMASRSFARRGAADRTRDLFLASLGLGAMFVALQGHEWVRLVWFGLTLTSSTYGSFFYLVVGTHALHAVAALVALGWAYARLRRRTLGRDTFWAVRIFWYFVVAVWPILYVLVYLL